MPLNIKLLSIFTWLLPVSILSGTIRLIIILTLLLLRNPKHNTRNDELEFIGIYNWESPHLLAVQVKTSRALFTEPHSDELHESLAPRPSSASPHPKLVPLSASSSLQPKIHHNQSQQKLNTIFATIFATYTSLHEQPENRSVIGRKSKHSILEQLGLCILKNNSGRENLRLFYTPFLY